MGRKQTGPSAETRKAVLTRDNWQCVRCGHSVTGEPGVDYSIHHRIPRGMGGSRDERLNRPANLLTLCGSGTTGCHGEVESNRVAARAHGYLAWRSDCLQETPVTVAILPGDASTPPLVGRFVLDDDGSREEVTHEHI